MERSEPTFGELVAALKSLDRPETGISKHLSTIIVGAVLAIGVWTVSSVNASQVTMGEIKVTVEASAKQIDTLITQQGTMAIEVAELKQRVGSLERKEDGVAP